MASVILKSKLGSIRAMETPVFAVILNWNNLPDTTECIESLRCLDAPLDRIIVVDNASTDGSAQYLRDAIPEVTILDNSQNLGFAGGNNVGIRYALEQGAERVLLLNNDTVVSPSFLQELTRAMDRDSSVGIAGPKIYFYSHPKRLWFVGPKRSWLFGRPLQLGHRAFGQQDNADEQCGDVRSVGFLTGCALLISRKVIETIGPLDETFFAYFEDADFCLRASEAGFKLVYVPRATMWHKDALPSQCEGVRSLLWLYLGTRNTLVFMWKHGRLGGWPIFGPLFAIKTLRLLVGGLIHGQYGVFRAVGVAIGDFARGRLGPGSVDRFLAGYSESKMACRSRNVETGV